MMLYNSSTGYVRFATIKFKTDLEKLINVNRSQYTDKSFFV